MIRGALEPITTRQTWIDEIEVFSDEDGTPFDLTGATAQVALLRAGDVCGRGTFGFFYDWPAPTLVSASVAIIAVGVIQFTFTAAQIAALRPGQYVLGANVTRDGETAQLIQADISVIDGVVPQ